MYDRCITRGIVGSVLRVVYGNGNRIVQAPGMVAISYEMIHDTRVLYTDGRPHIAPGIRQYLGDSRARWEGDVLVVETTNLTDKTSIGANGNGLRHSDKMKITEQLQARRRRRRPVPDHGRRSGDLRTAVHALDAADAARRRRPAAVRLSRGQPGAHAIAQRRARRRSRRSQQTSRASSVRGGPCRTATTGGGGGGPAEPGPQRRRLPLLADVLVTPAEGDQER